MSISYVLQPNHLTADPNDFTARVIPRETTDYENVIELMIKRGSTVVRADILSVLEDYHSVIADELLAGRYVNTPGCNYKVSIKGVFHGPDDVYDAARHQVAAVASAGARVKRVIAAQSKTEIGMAKKPSPELGYFTDLETGEMNSIATPGFMGTITGDKLKYDPADDNQGIFFVAEEGTETRVTAAGSIKPGRLMFIIPALPSGTYKLLVRSLWREAEIREGRLYETISVA